MMLIPSFRKIWSVGWKMMRGGRGDRYNVRYEDTVIQSFLSLILFGIQQGLMSNYTAGNNAHSCYHSGHETDYHDYVFSCSLSVPPGNDRVLFSIVIQ
jgi:hypothetical protein